MVVTPLLLLPEGWCLWGDVWVVIPIAIRCNTDSFVPEATGANAD